MVFFDARFISIKIYLESDIKLLCIVKFIAFPVPIISLKDTISLLNRPWMLPSSIVCVKTKEIYWTGMCWRANILRWLYIHSEINHWAFNLGIFIWNKTIRDEKGVEVPENFMTIMGEDVGRLRWMMVKNEDCRLVM
jgi:hypothetical protein